MSTLADWINRCVDLDRAGQLSAIDIDKALPLQTETHDAADQYGFFGTNVKNTRFAGARIAVLELANGLPVGDAKGCALTNIGVAGGRYGVGESGFIGRGLVCDKSMDALGNPAYVVHQPEQGLPGYTIAFPPCMSLDGKYDFRTFAGATQWMEDQPAEYHGGQEGFTPQPSPAP